MIKNTQGRTFSFGITVMIVAVVASLILILATVAQTTPTPTIGSTPTVAPTPTEPAATPTDTPVPTSTPVPTDTPVPTATSTPVPSDTPVPTSTPTSTSTPVPATPTNTPVPTATATSTSTPVPTATSTPVPTSTPTETPSETSTPTETPVVTETPTPTPTGNGDGKITICHIPPGHPENAHTIVIAPSAFLAHMGHGDLMGACQGGSTPTPTSTPTNTPTPTQEEFTRIICHVPDENYQNGQTLELPNSVAITHLTQHKLDSQGPCGGKIQCRLFCVGPNGEEVPPEGITFLGDAEVEFPICMTCDKIGSLSFSLINKCNLELIKKLLAQSDPIKCPEGFSASSTDRCISTPGSC